MIKVAQQELASYPDETQWLFQRIDGYLDLGMDEAANRLMDDVPFAYVDGIVYSECLLRLYFLEEDWSGASQLAETLVNQYPVNPAYWLKFASAMRWHRSVRSAERILREASKRFPNEEVITYNLACYQALEGKGGKALTLLRPLFKQDETFLDIALVDDDLRSIWEEIRQTG